MWRCAEIWPVEHKPFRHSTMRSGSSSSSSRFKIHPKQVNASTCDFDWCCLQSGDNTGTHLHVSRKAICRPKQQLHVSTSMESPMSFVSRLWMFLIPSVTRFWCETLSSVSILLTSTIAAEHCRNSSFPSSRRRVMRSSNCQDAHAPKTPHWKLQKDRFSIPDCCR